MDHTSASFLAAAAALQDADLKAVRKESPALGKLGAWGLKGTAVVNGLAGIFDGPEEEEEAEEE